VCADNILLHKKLEKFLYQILFFFLSKSVSCSVARAPPHRPPPLPDCTDAQDDLGVKLKEMMGRWKKVKDERTVLYGLLDPNLEYASE
jgi:hypothetical protein